MTAPETVKERHARTCATPHACLLPRIVIGTDRGGQNRFTAELLSGHQSAHVLTHEQWWGRTLCPVCPCPSPTPLRPPLTSSLKADPPSVCCGPDQQPRQYNFHHSGPQCLFHKLSQALGLKGCIGTGFGLWKHTNSGGWQVGVENSLLLCHQAIPDSFASTGYQWCTSLDRCSQATAPWAPPSHNHYTTVKAPKQCDDVIVMEPVAQSQLKSGLFIIPPRTSITKMLLIVSIFVATRWWKQTEHRERVEGSRVYRPRARACRTRP